MDYLKLKKILGLYKPFYKRMLENGEPKVNLRCPHRHGEVYESKASCGFDFEKNTYNCFSCGKSGTITGLLQNQLDTPKETIDKLLHIHTYLEDYDYQECLDLGFLATPMLEELNLYDEDLVSNLRIGSNMEGSITIPVYINDNLVDVRVYNKDLTPKLKGMKGSKTGLIVPYDIWKKDPRKTILCAGEKDMLTLRKNGFNAVTLTGGENASPVIPKDFKGQPVYICYDNDQAGKKGATKVAQTLLKYSPRVYIVDISKVCVGDKEDVWDFFNVYGKTAKDFESLVKSAEQYTEVSVAEERTSKYPQVYLSQAISTHINRFVSSQLQVQAGFGETYTVFTKYMFECAGNIFEFEMEDRHLAHICELIDHKITEAKVLDIVFNKYCSEDMKFDDNGKDNRKNVTIKKLNPKTVYKYLITDGFGRGSASDPVELPMYFLDCKPENGQEYSVIYKVFPHPTQGMQHFAIANFISDDGTVLNGFKVNDNVIKALKVQQRPKDMSIDDYMKDSYLRMRSHGEAHNLDIFQAVELTLHSALELSIGTKKKLRGTLDVLNIGNSRNGKSSTTKTCTDVRGLGKIMSLKSSTIESIVGGSEAVRNGKFVIKPGAVCTNDRRALVLEELSGAREGLVPRLTDIRSSQLNRISRVSGTSTIPARCRYYWISNPPKQKDGTYKQVQDYANGLELIKDLVPAQEDIARYDFFLISPAVENIDFTIQVLEPDTRKGYTKEELKLRLLWAWTRTKEDIHLSKETEHYLAKKCTVLARKYVLPVQIFGNETLDKVLRIAASIAIYTVSTKDFKQVDVTQEHVDWAIEFMEGLYDNDVFKVQTLLKNKKGEVNVRQ